MTETQAAPARDTSAFADSIMRRMSGPTDSEWRKTAYRKKFANVGRLENGVVSMRTRRQEHSHGIALVEIPKREGKPDGGNPDSRMRIGNQGVHCRAEEIDLVPAIEQKGLDCLRRHASHGIDRRQEKVGLLLCTLRAAGLLRTEDRVIIGGGIWMAGRQLDDSLQRGVAPSPVAALADRPAQRVREFPVIAQAMEALDDSLYFFDRGWLPIRGPVLAVGRLGFGDAAQDSYGVERISVLGDLERQSGRSAAAPMSPFHRSRRKRSRRWPRQSGRGPSGARIAPSGATGLEQRPTIRGSTNGGAGREEWWRSPCR